MKPLIVIPLILFLFISCRDNKSAGPKDLVRGDQALSPETAKDLSRSEFSTAQSICESLVEKTIQIQNLQTKRRFLFSRSKKSCSSKAQSLSDFSATLDRPQDYRDRVSFQSAPGNINKQDFIYSLFLEFNPMIESFCVDVLNGENPGNMRKQGRYYFKYRIFGANNIEIFRYRNIDGKWWPINFEALVIDIRKGAPSEGMALSRYQGSFCRVGSTDMRWIEQSLK